MHIYHAQVLTAVSLLLLATTVGLIRFRIMDSASRLLVILIVVALISESIGWFSTTYYHTNMVVYYGYSIIESVLVSLYFNQIILRFRRHGVGYWIAVGMVIFGCLNYIFLRQGNATGSVFLTIWGIMSMLFSLFYIAQAITFSNTILQEDIHFWFSLHFLFYSAATLLHWIPYDYLTTVMDNKWLVDRTLFAIGQISSIVFIILFWLSVKFRRHEPI